MKFYISSRYSKKEEVRRIYDTLRQKGHEGIGDWIEEKDIKPYEKNIKLTKKRAIKNTEGIRNSDVFILITDEAGTDMYAELGIAISSQLDNGKPIIYIIGDYQSRSSFFFHPLINKRKTIEEILRELE